MTSFPTGFGRIPLVLRNRSSLAFLGQTNAGLFDVQRQLSTGIAVNRFSDDPIRAASISAIDGRLEKSEQRLRNLEYAGSSLDTLDASLSELQDLVNEAKSLGSEQIGSIASESERKAQAAVVDSMIASLLRIANQESVIGHVFGGNRPGSPPVVDAGGSYQYVGGIGGLLTDIGLGGSVPVTLGAENTIGDVSNRVEGSVDLDPALTLSTRLDDLRGANGVGIDRSAFNLSFNAGPVFQVDLSEADTVGDVADAITAAILQAEIDQSVSILGPGGVSISGESFTIDVPAGNLVATDQAGATSGSDLGLVFDPSAPFNAGTTTGNPLDPELAWTTPVSALQGITPPLGVIQISNNARVANVDLSGAATLADIRSLIEASVPGTRVQLDDNGRSINVVTEIAGGRDRAMWITEVPGNNDTAAQLGIRTFMDTTKIDDFNDGRGVQVVSGRTDPITGLLDPALNVDFTITLGDGFQIDIDLQPSDMDTVQTVLSAINAQADAALTGAARPVTDFDASLPTDRNGFLFAQDAAIPGTITIERKNNSLAAEQLGLLDGKPDASGDNFHSTDRAVVRVDNLFTHLIDLRDALLDNDQTGILFASEKIEAATERLTETHGLVGAYAQRVKDETTREEDRALLDESVRSSLRDTDYAEAATRLSLLQTQLQATLQVTAATSQLSLLNFL